MTTHEPPNNLTATGAALAHLVVSDSGIIQTATAVEDASGQIFDDLAGTPLTRWLPDSLHEPVETGLRQMAVSGSTWLDGQRLRASMATPDDGETEVELVFQRRSDDPETSLTCTVRQAQPDDAAQDTTMPAQLDQRVQELSDWLAALSDNNPDIVVSLDPAGVTASVNPAAIEILGYERYELVGSSFQSLLTHDHQEQFQRELASASKGSSEQFEVTAWRQSGAEVELRVKLIPATLERKDVGVWVVASDITDSKQAFAEARRAQASLESAQRIADMGNFEWNAQTRDLYWSDGLYRILGLDPETFTISSDAFMELVHPEDRDELSRSIEQALEQGTPYESETRMTLPSGDQRIHRARGEVVYDDHGNPTGIVGTTLDITDLKEHEYALNLLVTTLEDKNRALELTTAEQQAFIYSVSHDLRSPLISIQGLTEIVVSDYADALDETGMQYLNRVLANVQRLQDMLTGLLELSRIGRTERSSRQDVDLQALVTDIVDEMHDGDRGDETEFTVENDLPTVHANYSRMAQVFSNLLDNAIKYTPRDRTPKIAVRSRRKENGWEISVSDNGVGIPADQGNAAIGMFTRLPQGEKLNPSGSGLGLATVSRIVQSHGGVLRFESNEGGGTTISFTIADE